MSTLLEKLDFDDGTEKELVEICPLCGGGDTKFLFWNFDRVYHLPGKFGTYSCDNCGLIRLSPRPTVNSIDQYYPEDYGAYTTPASIHAVRTANQRGIRGAIRTAVLSELGYSNGRLAAWQKVLRPVLTRFFFDRATYGYGDLFPRFVEGGHALEIGCGNGAFLSFLKHHGWRVSGVDLSLFATQQAKQLFDIEVFNGELENAPFSPESFDFIRLSHVLEHFYDPLESMKKVCSLLKPGGIVYVEVPNVRGQGAEIYKHCWYGWDAPRHLFMFTPETLRLSIEKAGLQISRMQTVLCDFSEWSMTFRYEAEIGNKLPDRPSIKDSDRQKVKNEKVESERRFAADKNTGDLIRCWATKLQGK